jgi:hypothetical protein
MSGLYILPCVHSGIQMLSLCPNSTLHCVLDHAALPLVRSKYSSPYLSSNFTIKQPFQRHIKINSDHMRYLYHKDKRALPENLQNRSYSFLPPPPKCSISHYPPLSFSSLCLSLSLIQVLFGDRD